ncbi:uncharacterized protein LOC142826672 [Pelodiscus sinensis]|uniref:uncharacterized protein LOC142826672 n=1 Tax=Pelodiscus sinensis TaxID=13735 RepID=UPI003F6D084F
MIGDPRPGPQEGEAEGPRILELVDGDFIQEQREDPSLRHAWSAARDPQDEDAPQADRPTSPYFEVRHDRLYRVDGGQGGDSGVEQLLVPKRYRQRLMELAHANPWAGHLGAEKTVQRIIRRFYWPGIFREVQDFCGSCPECQKVRPKGVPKAPLVPLPVVGVPFARVAMDIVGPLDKSKTGHQYILLLLDYATRYLEAIPLRNVHASTLAAELVKIFARVGLPEQILTDQGTNFTSRLMNELSWKQREAFWINPVPPDPELGPGDLDGATPPQAFPTGTDLTEAQRNDLEELLRTFGDVLTAEPGQTTLIHHHIETEPRKTVCERVRPVPRRMWETVRGEVQKMLQWGVVEESFSEWRSPIVLVPKPDGSLRFCIDFRKVNAQSRFDAYPMPRVDELLDRLGGARYLSTLDLTRGYWQIPLTPTSREKTAFSTPFGLYHFTRMPFGLHGAAATFQRLMDRVLREQGRWAAAYIDDIVVYSQTWGEHLQHVGAVLQALREAGLTANPRKCRFGEKETPPRRGLGRSSRRVKERKNTRWCTSVASSSHGSVATRPLRRRPLR